jgi:methylmalonyl-CoA mutase cobalamin-binding domain/chain
MTLDEGSQKLIQNLYDAVVNMDEDLTAEMSRSILARGIDPGHAVKHGLMAAMEKVGELYAADTYYVSELLLCADALHAGLEILAPHMEEVSDGGRNHIVIGTVEGDIHDVGKNLVKAMFEATGWAVHDLGKDVAPERFVEEQARTEAPLVALSALMSTTMLAIPKAIKMIKDARPDVSVLVGGAPLSREVAASFGADGYAHNAGEAIAEAKALLARVGYPRQK